MPVQMSLDDEIVALLDDYAEAHTNNNRTRLVQDLAVLADEATAATGEDDPRAAIEELLNDYSGYARDADYDPHEPHELTPSELEEMCVRDPVPRINPDHVIPPEMPSDTWTKAGVIAGMIRWKHDDPLVEEVEEKNTIGVKNLINRYCGGRSSVSVDDVKHRLDTSIPEVEKIDVDVGDWLVRSEKYASEEDSFMESPDPGNEESFLEGQLEHGEEVVRALRLDGDDRYERAKEFKEQFDERLTELEMEAMDKAATTDD